MKKTEWIMIFGIVVSSGLALYYLLSPNTDIWMQVVTSCVAIYGFLLYLSLLIHTKAREARRKD